MIKTFKNRIKLLTRNVLMTGSVNLNDSMEEEQDAGWGSPGGWFFLLLLLHLRWCTAQTVQHQTHLLIQHFRDSSISEGTIKDKWKERNSFIQIFSIHQYTRLTSLLKGNDQDKVLIPYNHRNSLIYVFLRKRGLILILPQGGNNAHCRPDYSVPRPNSSTSVHPCSIIIYLIPFSAPELIIAA